MAASAHATSTTDDDADYVAYYNDCMQNPNAFWDQQARQRLQWRQLYDKVADHNLAEGQIRWFTNGKLNVAENCIDRHVESGRGDATALIYEADEPGTTQHITYKELQEQVNRLANVLLQQGVKQGDRVCLYLPMTPYAVYAMLACARIGAIHTLVFAGFSEDALAARISDGDCRVLITADESVRGGKKIPLRQIANDALAQIPGQVRAVLVQERTGKTPPQAYDIKLYEAMAAASPVAESATVDAEDGLFLLYTSGSTGAPKGLLHTSGGYLLYAGYTHEHFFDYKPGDIYACLADVGWITGHTYVVYGPLVNGATTVIFESVPTYPDASRYWEMVERLRINQLYTAPTALRLLMKQGDDFVQKHDRSSLRVLGSVGEPINPEVWRWFHDVVGNKQCRIADTWWQTETGGIMMCPSPLASKEGHKPGAAMHPAVGVVPLLLGTDGQEIKGNDVEGLLCLRDPTPGMARTVFGNHKRFCETYWSHFPGYYFTGDGAKRDSEGHYHITGRVDDVINVSGHRLGTAEVESSLLLHKGVAESAVVGYPHDVKGEGICAYVILRADFEPTGNTAKELKEVVRHHIGAFASPDRVQLVKDLPKTRSGKIMRRILRKIASNQLNELGDLSTLAEPKVVDEIIEGHKEFLG
ncbi:uncharacterized protein MONBRDRAFT_13263 [Monosiga brevicollis MX1]|uniref:Acetyl-coenzyme A synthetase n=1 Tax=Monosiga brevicollis TaxID=81824 RepID=A9UNP6_MONBE|nr:uncharacterized protein MONBRDRAFT_13263 [Monosiga brevicollis MX1]EDQ92280.1 predicted protein [Monosiga brevicollis MX1]|eukprot:XP_001742042.1 hypothetical protein [Monosiga brevicollis MX1]